MTVSLGAVRAVDIAAIGIVVPARNEEERLPRCLTGLEAAARELRAADITAPRVRIIVVVDDSIDRTEQIARAWAGVEVVHSTAGRVGAARAAGVRHLLATESRAGVPSGAVWIACTDADSAVPVEWLQTHVAHARSGVDLLLGTVRPDPRELAAGVLAAYRLRHLIADGHPHVHGANLGVRADAYLAAGSFPDVACHEDVLLSQAVRDGGGRVLSTGDSPVLTSGRSHGRAPDGLAHYLRELGSEQISLQA